MNSKCSIALNTFKCYGLHSKLFLNLHWGNQMSNAASPCTTCLYLMWALIYLPPLLSSLQCSVTVLLHKLSRAWCARFWMLSKCFCRGEWEVQPPAVLYSCFRQVQGKIQMRKKAMWNCTTRALQEGHLGQWRLFVLSSDPTTRWETKQVVQNRHYTNGST